MIHIMLSYKNELIDLCWTSIHAKRLYMTDAMDEAVVLTAPQFEAYVEQLLKELGIGLEEFKTQRLEKLMGSDGEYEIDITARFEALGAKFLVLIECKHHKNPIKREIVQVLNDRLHAVGGHKGMIFATAPFQRGAVEYAHKHGIALVQIADGKTCWISKSLDGRSKPPAWIPQYVGWLVRITADGNIGHSLMSDKDPQKLLDRFREQLED